MRKDYLEKIEFWKVVERIYPYTSNLDTICLIKKQKLQKKSEELLKIIAIINSLRKLYREERETYPDLKFEGLSEFFKRIEKENSYLSLDEFKKLIEIFTFFLQLSNFLKKRELNFSPLYTFNALNELTLYLEKYIDIKNLSIKKGTLKDYDDLNDNINSLEREINFRLKEYLNKYQSYFKDGSVVFNNNKYVLLIDKNFQGKLKGNVIAYSNTLSSIYFEPSEILDLNNSFVLLMNERNLILLKLLKSLTNSLRKNLKQIKGFYKDFLYYDSLKARAFYGEDTSGFFPRIGDLNLINAIHPLVENFVPLNLKLIEGKKCVIISGPNAGGKTIVLKTLSLFTSLFQFAVPLNLSQDSSLPIFDTIFIDLGDNQSLEASLSTFQARLKNVAYILDHITKQSLILLDEPCSATNLEEGLSLTQALIEHFLEIGALTFITTHSEALKYFAYTNFKALNASMHYDLETFMPTYKLQIGIPGESFALVLAERLKIKDSILRRAEDLKINKELNLIKILDKLSLKERELLEREKALYEKSLEIDKLKNELYIKEMQLKLKEKNLEEERLLNDKEFLKDLRRERETLIRNIKEGSFNSALNRSLEEKVLKDIERIEENISQIEREYKSEIQEFNIGEIIYLPFYKREGRVLLIKADELIVELGNIKINVSKDNVEKVKVKRENSKFTYSVEKERAYLAVFTINIRKLRLNEALEKLEEGIDNVLVNNIFKFEIIHGKGEGILQNAVHKYLKNLRYVDKFYFALPQDGGTGKTIVELKL